MYVYIYTYINMYKYTYKSVDMCTCVHGHVYMCTRTCVHVYTAQARYVVGEIASVFCLPPPLSNPFLHL